MAARKPRKLAEEELFEYALKSLSAKAQSAGDLDRKLRWRAASAPDIAKVISRLKEIGYLDDRRFAETYAAARVENEGFGRLRVLQDLRARRIAPDLASRAVENALGDMPEAEQIEAFIRRRMPSLAAETALEDDRKLAAAYRKLRRAGFSTGPVLAALKKRASRPEVLDDPPPEEEDTEE